MAKWSKPRGTSTSRSATRCRSSVAAVYDRRIYWRKSQRCDTVATVEMKIVLAYSGGLDTSVILRWLKDNYQAEIIAFCADIGQEEELAGLEDKALKTGETKCLIED